MENVEGLVLPSIPAAVKAVLSEPNTYLYAHRHVASYSPMLKDLKMEDISKVAAGIGLQKDLSKL